MPPLGPISRRGLIRGSAPGWFRWPLSQGGKLSFMLKGDMALVLPNSHQGDIGRGLLTRILKQAGVSRGKWEKLG